MNDSVAIFHKIAEGRFAATPAAAGPWTETHCHGGAPCALLAASIEGVDAAAAMDVARLTVDLVRPVPLEEPLTVELRERHRGRTVQLVEAWLYCGDALLARATALKVRSQPSSDSPAACEAPDVAARRPMPGGFSGEFTIVPVTGGFGEPGPADVWLRLDSPIVPGADPSPLQCCVAAADFGSGIAHEVDFRAWRFPSLDLTVSLARPARGDWIRLRSRWLGASGGRTTCVTALSDLYGAIGEAVQTVLLEPRPHQ